MDQTVTPGAGVFTVTRDGAGSFIDAPVWASATQLTITVQEDPDPPEPVMVIYDGSVPELFRTLPGGRVRAFNIQATEA